MYFRNFFHRYSSYATRDTIDTTVKPDFQFESGNEFVDYFSELMSEKYGINVLRAKS